MVAGDVDDHRPRPPGAGDVERLVDRVRDVVGRSTPIECLEIGSVMPSTSVSWKAFVPRRSLRTWAQQEHGRDRVHVRVGDRRREVRRARAARHERDADAAARLRVALGGVAGPRLVAHEDVADRAVVQRVVDGQARAAGQPEDAVGALALEGGDQPVGAAHRACRAEGVRTEVSTSMGALLRRSFGRDWAREARQGAGPWVSRLLARRGARREGRARGAACRGDASRLPACRVPARHATP